MMYSHKTVALAIGAGVVAAGVFACSGASMQPERYDLVIRNGTIYDGMGGRPYAGDVAVSGDRIVAVGAVSHGRAVLEIDARGQAVAPGFINVLSWVTNHLSLDSRATSDIRQGVTLEVVGEGSSMGPRSPQMRAQRAPAQSEQTQAEREPSWTTLGEYFEGVEARGISPNIASFVGATTLRIHELGYADRAPTAAELSRMQDLAARAMADGALGLSSALIYAPAFYAKTDELIALAQAIAPYRGMYISHMRSEGDRLLESIDELIAIARAAGVPAEIYHMKAAGVANWDKLDAAIERIEQARSQGVAITANMYTYTAAATGLNASMPPWVQEGGLDAWIARLKEPTLRARVIAEMQAPARNWENYLRAAGSADRIRLIRFRSEQLRPLAGKTLAQVAALRGKSPEETAMDLVIEDASPVGTVYFMMSEENVQRQTALPWMSFVSDSAAPTAAGEFLTNSSHPRAYGNFARLLGKYVRDERTMSLQEAIRKLTSQPAGRLKIRERGSLVAGNYADIVVFDPAKIEDHATYDNPHQYATGVSQVFVNGVQVLRDGEHTGALPGRFVRGPGWRGWSVAAADSKQRAGGFVHTLDTLLSWTDELSLAQPHAENE